MTGRSTAHRALLAVALVGTVALAGCGGSSSGGLKESPSKALSTAKKTMDSASSWHLSLETKSTPEDGVLSASGVGTHDPQAWKGTVTASIKGVHAKIPVVSVDGKVYAKIPFTPGYSTIDPADYGAPDPADFMDPASGLSTLLTEMKGAKKTGTARAGKEIVTTYAGTLAGKDVQTIIPSASSSGTFATTIALDEDHHVTSVSVTGPFFSGDDSVTYDLSVDDYGQDVKISAP